MKTYTAPVSGVTPDYAGSGQYVDVSEMSTIKVPSGTNYIVFNNIFDNVNYLPVSVAVTGKSVFVEESEDSIVETGFFFEEDKDISEDVLASTSYQYRIQASTNAWQAGSGYLSYILDISKMRAGKLKITANSSRNSGIAFLKSNTIVEGETPDYAGEGSFIIVAAGEDKIFNIPDDAKYLYVQYQSSSLNIIWPDSLSVVGKYYSIGEKDSGKLIPLQGINYFEVDINPNVLPNGSSAEENIDSNTTVKSSFGVRFPANYTPDGEPCRVMAMFHGYQGYVAGDAATGVGTILGYNNHAGWVDFQDVFVNAGYVVFDINGYGLYDANNNNNHHWGCPGAVLTAKKAFEYLKQHYNVCDQMLIFGFSMGGAMGYSYAFNFPEDVAAMALHEPALQTNNRFALTLSDLDMNTIAEAFGYQDWAAATSDGYKNMQGYGAALAVQVYMNGLFEVDGMVNPNYTPTLTGLAADRGMVGVDLSSELPTGMTLTGKINCPVRVWQGLKQNNVGEDRVTKASVVNIINAFRAGGSNATVRLCPGLRHSELKATQYVVDETLAFLNRYK